MQYSINIYEKGNPNAITVFEHAEATTLQLYWSGSNDKLRTIIGSDLSFTMEVTDFQDGFFAHLITYDERQYRVEIYDEEKQREVWNGHLLPDLYDEPYTNGAFFINFTAACGLASLRKSYLPNEYYQNEYSLAQIVAQCLLLTGLELDIYISPAVRNKINPQWHQNYVDTQVFVEDGEKLSAYEILEKVLGPINCIFQQENRWYILGLNKFSRFTIEFDVYDFEATYTGTDSRLRDAIDTIFYNKPRIGVHAPRRTVSASYEVNTDQIPTSAYKVVNDQYVLNNHTTLTNHDWAYTDISFRPQYSSKDGNTYLGSSGAFDDTLYIELRRPVLFYEGEKINWVFAFKSAWDSTVTAGKTVEELVADGDWENLVRYDVYYTDVTTGNDVILFSNQNGAASSDERYQIYFTEDREASLSVPFTIPETAYYNIRIYRPIGVLGDKTDRIYISELQAQVLKERAVQTYTDEIKEVYTQTAEVDLFLHDDVRALDNMIRLTPLEQFGDTYDDVEVLGSLVTVNTATANYIKLTIQNLLLALAYSDDITVEGTPLLVLGAEYNYLGSNEFLLQYDADAYGALVQDGDNMSITRRKYADLPADLADWTSYTDDFYGITYKRYGAAVTDVLRNLFNKPHWTMSGECRGFVSFLDLVAFDYLGPKIWYPLNVTWQLDQFKSELSLSQNFYGDAVTDNLPPQVDAGLDQLLATSDNDAVLVATASDPDGTIETVLWELVSGDTAVTFTPTDALTTTVTGLTGNAYEFRVTVTDNVGLTATDTVRVNRTVEYTLVLQEQINTVVDTEFEYRETLRYLVYVSPALSPGQTARIIANGILIRDTPVDIAGAKPTAVFQVNPYVAYYDEAGSYEATFLQRTGDDNTLTVIAGAFNSVDDGIFPNVDGNVHAKVQVDITAEIVEGAPGTFTNTPLQVVVEATM